MIFDSFFSLPSVLSFAREINRTTLLEARRWPVDASYHPHVLPPVPVARAAGSSGLSECLVYFGSSCGAQEPKSADWPERTSAVHIIQHPDAAGLFRHGQIELVLGERKSDRRYPPWNHQSGAFKFRHLKRLPNWLSRVPIEVDPQTLKKPPRPVTK